MSSKETSPMMRLGVVVLLTFLALVLSDAQAHAEPVRPMNVLFLIVDDLNTWLLEDPTRYAGRVVPSAWHHAT